MNDQIDLMKKKGNEDITLLDVFSYLVNNISLIAKATVLTIAMMLIYVLLIMENIYQAGALVQPVNQESGGSKSSVLSQLGGLTGFSSLTSMSSLGSTQGSVATLQSRSFLLSFIDEHKIAPILFPNRWNTDKNDWADEPPSDWDVYYKFKSKLSIDMSLQSGLYTISIKHSDGKQAADWVNDLISYINLHLRESAINEAKKSIKYLEDELNSTSQEEIRDSIFSLMQQQMTTAMLANVQNEYAFKILDPAVSPQDRIGMPRSQIMILSSFIGFLIGLILAFMKGYYFDDRNKKF